jgi:hypothetical protein
MDRREAVQELHPKRHDEQRTEQKQQFDDIKSKALSRGPCCHSTHSEIPETSTTRNHRPRRFSSGRPAVSTNVSAMVDVAETP